MLLSRHSVPTSYLVTLNARSRVTGAHVFTRAKLASRSPGYSSFTINLQQLEYKFKICLSSKILCIYVPSLIFFSMNMWSS